MSRDRKSKITPEVEEHICNLMKIEASRSKDGKVNLVKIAEQVGISRPTLYGNAVIKNLYQQINGGNHKPAEKKVTELEEKLKKLTAERSKLKKTLKEYDEKYSRWMYNATIAGLSVEQLNQPVPESLKTTSRKKNG